VIVTLSVANDVIDNDEILTISLCYKPVIPNIDYLRRSAGKVLF